MQSLSTFLGGALSMPLRQPSAESRRAGQHRPARGLRNCGRPSARAGNAIGAAIRARLPQEFELAVSGAAPPARALRDGGGGAGARGALDALGAPEDPQRLARSNSCVARASGISLGPLVLVHQLQPELNNAGQVALR